MEGLQTLCYDVRGENEEVRHGGTIALRKLGFQVQGIYTEKRLNSSGLFGLVSELRDTDNPTGQAVNLVRLRSEQQRARFNPKIPGATNSELWMRGREADPVVWMGFEELLWNRQAEYYMQLS